TPPTIMLRLGSGANRTDQVAFDGAFTALTVRRVSEGMFAGSWRSGVGMDVTEGYFCAVRR
ncbi:MAG: hypothetical protein OEN56_15710, partial [Gemmatimonadota bacterium]|nr:hypothetical protein [Gemmatimonadota bacterium]